jgi:exodeoxyribonuclease VIII
VTTATVEAKKIVAPEPGIYPNVPAEEYFAWEAMNRSTLEHASRSMMHLHAAMTTPSQSSAAMDLGTALHCAVLEPDSFSRRYKVAPECDRRTKVGKATFEAFVKESSGATVLDSDSMDLVQHMANAIRCHERADKLLAVPGENEVCVVWDDAETGIRCKARIDRYACGKIGVDIKTTRNASPGAFSKSVFDYGYHRQMAWYADGFYAITGKLTPFVIVAVENDKPCGVCIYRLEDAAVEFGRDDNRRWLRQYAEAKASNRFDGYPAEVVNLGLPVWAEKRYERGEM